MYDDVLMDKGYQRRMAEGITPLVMLMRLSGLSVGECADQLREASERASEQLPEPYRAVLRAANVRAHRRILDVVMAMREGGGGKP